LPQKGHNSVLFINTVMFKNYHMQTSLIQCTKCTYEILLPITNFIYLQHCASEWLESSLENEMSNTEKWLPWLYPHILRGEA